MTRRVLIASLLFLSACSSSPTTPTRIVTAPVTATLKNQIDVAHSKPTTIDAGQTVIITLYLDRDPCETYQPDLYRGMPEAAHYTMSWVGNYLYDTPGGLSLPLQHCRLGPPHTTTTTIPVIHECTPQGFGAVSTNHVGGIEVVTITVPTGLGGFEAYLVSWGLPYIFQFGGVPLPQTQLHLVVQTLHDGVNIMTIALADSQIWPAWQLEGGCWDRNHPPPQILTSAQDLEHGGQFDWVFDDGGNF